jgi:hypothetical protein
VRVCSCVYECVCVCAGVCVCERASSESATPVNDESPLAAICVRPCARAREWLRVSTDVTNGVSGAERASARIVCVGTRACAGHLLQEHVCARGLVLGICVSVHV